MPVVVDGKHTVGNAVENDICLFFRYAFAAHLLEGEERYPFAVAFEVIANGLPLAEGDIDVFAVAADFDDVIEGLAARTPMDQIDEGLAYFGLLPGWAKGLSDRDVVLVVNALAIESTGVPAAS